MPRKTKKHKKQASQRRVIAVTATPAVEKKQVVIAAQQNYKPEGYDAHLRGYTMKDVTRTLVITAIMFGLQAAIFYIYQNNLLAQILP